jgi:Protein of unknown function (DUF2793).
MSDDTARLHLPQLVSLQELNAVSWNEALEQIDALADLCLLGQFVNTPPSSPQDGDAYLTGGAPTGAWSGYAYKIASCRDGVWRFYQPFNGLRAYVTPAQTLIVYLGGTWTAIASSGFATRSGTETFSGKTFTGSTNFPGGKWDASGNVGINTSNPATALDVNGTLSVGSIVANAGGYNNPLFFQPVSGDQNWAYGSYNSGSEYYMQVRYGDGGNESRGFRVFDTTNSIVAFSTGVLKTYVRGNLAIGTTTTLSGAKLDIAGNIYPHAANSYNLGAPSYCWANGYIQNAWTVVSDERLKDEIASLSEAEMAVAKAIAPLVATYKMKAAVAEKGSAQARRHCGWIAQRIEEIFAAHDLDPFAYGCVGFDPATKTVAATRTVTRPKMNGAEPVVAADGKPVMETVEEPYEQQVPDCDDDGVPRTIHNLRVAEVIAFALAGLAARVAALEAACGHA